jgi:hypothetical protein
MILARETKIATLRMQIVGDFGGAGGRSDSEAMWQSSGDEHAPFSFPASFL